MHVWQDGAEFDEQSHDVVIEMSNIIMIKNDIEGQSSKELSLKIRGWNGRKIHKYLIQQISCYSKWKYLSQFCHPSSCMHFTV